MLLVHKAIFIFNGSVTQVEVTSTLLQLIHLLLSAADDPNDTLDQLVHNEEGERC